jgi:nucleotide-binding universal stress UspA family protein
LEEATAAALFDSLWESLADLLGTAATATLLRRAIKRASADHAKLPNVIVNNAIAYEYELPDAWRQPNRPEALEALRALAGELGRLLVQLTGPVVVRRLQRHREFEKHGIRFIEERR